jgi:hypothetical protein
MPLSLATPPHVESCLHGGALSERMEVSRFRPIGRITNLRVKMKPQGREAESR